MDAEFELAFDNLIASHDVSDEAIDRLYNGDQPQVTTNDIRYAIFCGNVPPDKIKEYRERMESFHMESLERARLLREKWDKEAEEERHRLNELKAGIDKDDHETLTERTHNLFWNSIQVPKIEKPATKPKVSTCEELTQIAIKEFEAIIRYVDKRLREIDNMQDDIEIAEKITGSYHTDFYRTVIDKFKQLRDDFSNRDSEPCQDVLSSIQNGKLVGSQMVRDYTRALKSEAKALGLQYSRIGTETIKNAHVLAIGNNATRQSAYINYLHFCDRVWKKPALYVMKVMCETLGNHNWYNDKTRQLQIPLWGDISFYPADYAVMTATDYSTPLTIIWAMNTITDNSSYITETVARRSITDYFDVINMTSSDMLYISYGMNVLGKINHNIHPEMLYQFSSRSTFVRSCKTIYKNEQAMKAAGEKDSEAKKFFMEKYFHMRNQIYASFNTTDSSWDSMAETVARLSRTMLAQYKGGES